MRLRRALSASVAVLLAALATVLFLGMLRTVPDTLQHDAEIESAFLMAASWADAFKRDNGRFPSTRELQTWSATQNESFWLKSVELISDPSHFPSEAKKAFGPAPTEGYVLELWRGEWNEYFASWTRTTTIGSSEDTALFIVQWLILSLFISAASFFLWRFGRQKT